MTPSEVRAALPQALAGLRDSIVSFIQKKDLVLCNKFQDVAGEDTTEIDLTVNVSSEDSSKYNILQSRVNIMIRDDDSQSDTYNGFKPLNGEVRWAIKTNGRLVLENTTSETVRLSVFVSANRT